MAEEGWSRLYREFQKWKSENGDQDVNWIRADSECIYLKFDGNTVSMTYPQDSEGIFFLSGEGSQSHTINDLNDYAVSTEGVTLTSLLNRMGSKKNLRKLAKSIGSDEGSEDDEAMEFKMDTEKLHFAENFPTHLKELENQVIAAQEIVGKETIRIYRDTGQVAITVDVQDALTVQLAYALDLDRHIPLIVTLDFSKKKFFDDGGMPQYSVSQIGKKDSFGVKFHLKEIVAAYLESHWEDRHGKTVKDIIQESIVAPPIEPKKQKTETKESSGPMDPKVSQMMELGFDPRICEKLLTKHGGNVERAIEALFSGDADALAMESDSTSNQDIQIAELTSMGFDVDRVRSALESNGWKFDAALDALISGSVTRNIALEEANAKIAQNFSRSKNFFVGIIAYVRSRLTNYTLFCIICHKRHNCKSVKPVVCCAPLCMFRYEDLKVSRSVDNCTICAFPACQGKEEMDANQEVLAAFVANKESTGMSHNILLEMYQHKYLPSHQMLDFIEKGVKEHRVKVKSVDNILRPDLVSRFERKWEEMKRKYGEVKTELAYHGTSDANVQSISTRGLLVPGKLNNGVTHATE
eukprot:TRINITY_DN8125_c0_g1_i1.p1 TRINITY_DN8125_c0_g1~~TRINITY_DN8125_c0_g1_i1.p1  ORF type:complete len:581 (-),score=169.64 TRINITY_DN8125_c0_g1_i1:337-2079(-)